MSAAFHPTYYDEARPPRPARPALATACEAEIAIVGGGLAGLATLLSLAERGTRAVLLEAQAVGTGASGRNGGFLHEGFPVPVRRLEARLGMAHSKALWALSREAVTLVLNRLRRHDIAAGAIPGTITASVFDDAAGLEAEGRHLVTGYGAAMRFLPRSELRRILCSPRYFDGLLDERSWHLDPLALVDGYAAAALARGAVIHEASPVLAMGRVGGRWRLATPEGAVLARHVVLCQSAYPPPIEGPPPIENRGDDGAAAGAAALRRLRRAVLPVFTYILVTEPLGERGRAAIRTKNAVYDDRFATGYYRLLPDGRLLWGGRIGLAEHPRRLEAALRRDLAFIYPQLAAVRVERAWSGRMGFTRHRMPILGEIAPSLWAATGFGGQGVAATTMAGELVASALAQGDERWRLFAPFQPLPVPGRLGRLAAQGLWWGYGARDGLRAGWHRWRAGRAAASAEG